MLVLPSAMADNQRELRGSSDCPSGLQKSQQ